MINIVGKDNLIIKSSELERYTRDLHYPLIKGITPNYVVTPNTAEAIQKIIKLGNNQNILIKIKGSQYSRYGSSLLEKEGIIIDLKKMNRIISVDSSTMHAIIEPGVNFTQLQNHLDSFDLRVLPNIFSNSDSVIFSYLSFYPFFAMSKFEYNENVVNCEIILPTGEYFGTGSMGSKKGIPVSPYGPSLDFSRIFYGSQGSFGIVSKATVKVKPKPKMQEIITIPFENYIDFVKFVYNVQKREIGTECLIINKTNLIKYFKFSVEKVMPEWLFITCLEGGKYYPELKISYEKEALEGIKTLYSIETEFSFTSPTEKLQVLDLFNCSKTFCHKSLDIPLYLTLNKFPEFYSRLKKVLNDFNEQEREIGITIIPIERNRVAYVELDFFRDSIEETNSEEYSRIFHRIGKLALDVGAIIGTPYGPLKDVINPNIDTYYKELIEDMINIFDPNRIFNSR